MILLLLGQVLSYRQNGTLYAVREIMVNVMELPNGALADGLGRRRTMVASFGGFYKGGKDYLQPMLSTVALAIPVAHGLSSHRREPLPRSPLRHGERRSLHTGRA